MSTIQETPIKVDLGSVSSSVIEAIEHGTDRSASVWTPDRDTPERSNGYTPTGAVHVLEARDHTLWRITVERVDTADPSDVVPALRPLLRGRPQGWYVADGLRVISGPFADAAKAEADRRRIAATRTEPAYKFPDGAPMPIWTPATYYWPGEPAA